MCCFAEWIDEEQSLPLVSSCRNSAIFLKAIYKYVWLNLWFVWPTSETRQNFQYIVPGRLKCCYFSCIIGGGSYRPSYTSQQTNTGGGVDPFTGIYNWNTVPLKIMWFLSLVFLVAQRTTTMNNSFCSKERIGRWFFYLERLYAQAYFEV